MAKYLFYLVSGYVWQILLYTTCGVELKDVPTYLFVILWVLLSMMTCLGTEELFVRNIRWQKERIRS